MAKTCGDDLIAARRFTNLCQKHMSDMFSGNEIPMADVLNRLGDIQSQAKLMQARAVYKSAQLVVEDLTSKNSINSCATSVLALQKIIQQYETGLNDVAPKTSSQPAGKTKSIAGPAIVSDMAAQTRAADILKPLVKLAPDDDRQSLVRLLSLAANDQPSKSGGIKRKFESIMPALTNHWLRLARKQGKSISVSVASGEVDCERSMLQFLQSRLSTIGEALIAQCVEGPDQRSAKGLSQSAHLAVTAEKNGANIDILVSCEGSLPSGLTAIAYQRGLTDIGAKLTLSEMNGVVKVEMSNVPTERTSADQTILREAVL